MRRGTLTWTGAGAGLITVAIAAMMFPSGRLAALNEGNAGPKDFKLKFVLPPPKPLSPEEALKTFTIEKGYRIELVAAEPLVQAPVAMSFDHKGGLYVAEMRGYMHDVEGTTESEPTGRVSYLTDRDGDGVMDHASVFLDKLVLPRGVMAVGKGALIAVPPNLIYCEDTDGDGVSDKQTIVAADYGRAGGQPEHMANSPTWMMDNWIWSANHNVRYAWDGENWKAGKGLGRGQWGLAQDDFGRPFYNYNSDMLRSDLLPARAYERNPLLRDAKQLNWRVLQDQAVWPAHPTPGVNRGYEDSSLRKDGSLTRATAAGGAGIYRGDAMPDLSGNAFVPEPAGNLLKRVILTEKDGVITGQSAGDKSDFLTSTDERFRPVFVNNGPDGALYIADMYRGIIQHSGFLTHYLVKNIEDRKLEAPFDMGRIYRIVKDDGKRPQRVEIPETTAGRVGMLRHPGGWVRDTAQRLLVEDKAHAAAAKAALEQLLADPKAPVLAKVHALWTLDGLTAISPEAIQGALNDSDPKVRATAVRLAPLPMTADLIALAEKGDADTLVNASLGLSLSGSVLPGADAALSKLLAAHGGNAIVREAVLTGMRGRELDTLRALSAVVTGKTEGQLADVQRDLARLIASAGKAAPVLSALEYAASKDVPAKSRSAIVEGLAPAKGNKDTKLLWLAEEPAALHALKEESSDLSKSAKEALERLDGRLAWPGKPGAPKPPVVKTLSESEQALREKGAVLFTAMCATCHQTHGYGLDGLAPPLVDSPWVVGNPGLAVRIILHGVSGPIKVGDRTFDLAMPALGYLKDEDVAAILTYIRREWEHTADPVSPDYVEKLRARYKNRVDMWTAEELSKEK